jgi:signal transduction histidine kinase
MKSTKNRLRRSVTGSLRTQLMIATVAPVTTLLIALVVVSVFSFTRLTQTLIEQRDSELVQLATRQVASYWADSVFLLKEIASADAVRTGDARVIQTLLTERAAPLIQRFDQVSITNMQGMIIATEGGTVGENVGKLAYFERARRLRRPVRSPVQEDAQGHAVIAVAVPLYDLGGQFTGCMLGIWELGKDRLGLPVLNVRVGEHGIAYLIDESGMILYHPDKDLVRADYSRHPAVVALLRGETGAQTVNDRGRTTVVGYAPIPLRQSGSSLVADETWDGWGLLTNESWDDIVAPLQPYVRLMLALLLLAVALPLTFLALNSRRIVAPLQSLVTQAERVASGEFDSQVSINAGPSEVRELELAFNTMVDQLRRYRSDIQNYVVSILNSQEDERKRIARELHDETAQALIVLGRHIEMAEELSEKEELTAQLEDLRDMVDDTLQGVRRFTGDLRPPLLEELGLPRTLELLGARTENEEAFTVNVVINGEPRQLLPELELGLYRLAQESLSNVRKHAQATHVELTLTYRPEAIELKTSDDGIGFEVPIDTVDLIKSGRLGLMGIYERARLFGGRAAISSAPHQGTQVTVMIPLTTILLPQTSSSNERAT